jgi:hypothetical protein
MRLVVVSESPSDEAGLRALVAPITGHTSVSETGLPQIRSRGWPSVKGVLPTIVKHLHYRTIVEALLVVVDSDDSKPHGKDCADDPRGCRLCDLRDLLNQQLAVLREVPGRARIKTAVGLCIPAIEAWYLCGRDPTVTEAAWKNGQREQRLPYSRSELKRRVYGTPIPQLQTQVDRAVENCRRLAADLTPLEQLFPDGCGTMLQAIRDW